jgi:hypothetical protein
MAVSIGDGKVIEAVSGAGVHIAPAPGWQLSGGNTIAGPMPDVGTTATGSGLFSDVAQTALPDWLAALPGAIADGILRALLTVVGFAYGFLVLRLIDFWGGFWWELTSKLLGEMAPWLEEIDLIKMATGQETETPELPPIRGGAILLDDEALNRLFFVLFAIFSYQLAFGRDQQGNNRLENILGGLGGAANVDLKGKRGKNTRATLKAEVVEEMVSQGVPRERASQVVGREMKKDEDAELRKMARSIMAKKRPRSPDGKKFAPHTNGSKAKLEKDTIDELVKMGVPREKAERTVRKGNVKEVQKSERES